MRIAPVLASLFVSVFLAACADDVASEAPPDAQGTPKVQEAKFDTTRPEGVLKELYTSYFTVLNNGGKAEAGNYVDKYFAPELAAKFAAAANSANSGITFDVFINAQDHQALTLGEIDRMLENAEHAIYDVHFTNNDEEQKVRIGLVKAGDTWKITEIQYGKDLSLSGILK